MNKRVLNQLNKVKAVELNINPDDNKVFIPKQSTLSHNILKKGEYYMIQFTTNPHHIIYVAECLDIRDDKFFLNAVAVDSPTDCYYGWVNKEQFTVLSKHDIM